ncbi:TetR/AcrR family transcriptional regulator [Kordiimonas pumila]|uniref:TetR/AcrR family transcriptional regulator n=1 Tax=Kordiimonas pumila TaxID=2161677 RepID=A0ABV7D8W2_9PROT|nr:TetR/AcrR family transcriptional regulator [Kordiimonas pumila]
MPSSKASIIKKAPKQKRSKARREEILKAANNLVTFAASSAFPNLDTVTTTIIAQEANIPVGSVYQYFTDRNDILLALYTHAYDDIEKSVSTALEALKPCEDFKTIIHILLTKFWETANTHASFKLLTRWSNSQGSVRDKTPDEVGGLGTIIERTLALSSVEIGNDRYNAVVKTVTVAISVLVDQAIEENNKTKAKQLIDELTILISSYIGYYKTTER